MMTLIWLPAGVALGGLLRWGLRCWPGVAIGAFAVNIHSGMAIPVSLAIAAGNTVGSVFSVWLLQRMGFRPGFDRKRDILLLVAGAIPGLIISATIGVATVAPSVMMPEGSLAGWLVWWAGETMGVITLVPLLLTMTRTEVGRISRRPVEFLVSLSVMFGLTWFIFILDRGVSGQKWPLTFIPLPAVAFASLRFGASGNSLALVVLSVLATYGTAHGHGPFARPQPIEGTIALWLFITTGAVQGWLITALQTARVQATAIQRLFEQALSDVELGVLLAGFDRRITYANYGSTRLTGYTEEELRGKNCSILQGPETDPTTLDVLKNALRGDGYFDGEILNYRKDGTTFWNGLLVSPIHDESGKMTGFLGIQRDVTGRKKAELALQQSEEHLRTIVELEPECVKLLSPAGTLLEMNPAGLAMIEASSIDEVRGGPIQQLIAPADRAAFAALHRQVMQGATGQCEFTIIGLKGTHRRMETHAVPYRNGQREIVGMLGITRDITERRRAAVELERSLATLQLFINSVPAYIGFVDAEERYRLVNHRYEEYFGIPVDKIIGKRLRDVHPAATYAEIQPRVREALAGKTVRFQINATNRDGRSSWVDAQYVPRRNDDGTISGFFALVFDITENKEAELALRESRTRLDGILNSMQDVVWSSSPDGSVMNFVSVSADAMYGVSSSEFMKDPMKWVELIHPEDRESVRRAFERVPEAGGFEAEYRIIHPDGAIRWLRNRGRIVSNDDGQPIRLDGIVTDITNRKHAEDRLRESEERLRLALSAANQGLYDLNVQTGECIVSPEYALMLGYDPAEFIETNAAWIERLHPDDRENTFGAFSEYLAGKLVEYRVEFRQRTKQGTWKWILSLGSLIARSADGRPLRMLGTHTDITARKLGDIQNAGERDVLELISSGAPLPKILGRLACSYEETFPGVLCSVQLLDADGCHLRSGANPSIPEAFSRAIDGMEIGLHAGSFGAAAFTNQTTISSEIATDPRWNGCRDLALNHGFQASCSVPLTSSQNRTLGTVTLYYRRPDTPGPERIAAIERGAHFASLAIERHELFRSIQESQIRLETLVSNLPGMAYRCQNDAAWTMSYVSDGCETVTGYRRDELENNRMVTFGNLVHPDDRDWLWKKCQASLDSRVPCQNEYRIIDRNNRERWVADRASGFYSDDGKLLFIDGFVQDITESRRAKIEREQLDRKMQDTQKLESLGVLAGGIAHDFNNLLTSILGNASIAALELPPGSPVHDCIEQINQASLRAADLCKQMLAYSGRGRFIVQTLDLGQLVEETAQMLQISISKKAILRFHLDKNLPPVEVDSTQIRQVIMNLVINASEAIGDRSGVIGLCTGLTRVDRDYLRGTLMDPDLPEGEYVFIEISDSGCGMNAETQARIFDPFFTTKFTGRGLGLAAVLGIVRGHKGALKVYSEVGRGTTFKLLFPAARGAHDAASTQSVAGSGWRGNGGTVLVVDDEETMRSTIARMMRHVNLDPVLVADGRAAVEVFAADPKRFSLVLLDLTMPHMDGEQTFTELRRIRPDVRVVLMSGFNAQEALVRFTGKGLASFLQKPFTVSMLRGVLQTVLD